MRHGELLKAMRADEVRHRLLTIPGVGAVVAITFQSRSRPARTLRTLQGSGRPLRPHTAQIQSGKIDRTGRISKVGDAMVRTALFEAANVMLTRAVRLSTLKAWALRVATRQGMKKAKVALARKLAVVMHRMWVDGTTFRWGKAGVTVAA
jgi:transposase